MEKRIIDTDQSPKAIGPYSQGVAVDAGRYIYTSGILPLDPETGIIAGSTIEEQTEKVLENLKAVLEAGGSSLSNVVKTTVYITDLKEFDAMNRVYSSFFSEEFPARATVEVSGLAKNAKVEIEAVGVCLANGQH